MTTTHYLAEYEGNVQAAVLAMAADLMRGDPVTFQAGYTLDNALMAAANFIAPEDAASVVAGIGQSATYAYLVGYGASQISGI